MNIFRNLKAGRMIFMSTLILFLCAGCKERDPEVFYKYTVWIGSAAFASGYDTNSYEILDIGVKFKTKSGIVKIVPSNSLLSIDEN